MHSHNLQHTLHVKMSSTCQRTSVCLWAAEGNCSWPWQSVWATPKARWTTVQASCNCRTCVRSGLTETVAALQAHMGRVELPITDYVGDTKSALDNSVRILQAITDVAADAGWLGTTLATMRLIQGLMQVRTPEHVCNSLHLVQMQARVLGIVQHIGFVMQTLFGA